MNLGVDIVENRRIENKYKKYKNFINKVLSINEINLFNSKVTLKDKILFLSGRWAAKEAIFKAISIKVPFNLIDIYYKNEKPQVKFLQSKYFILNNRVLISISHENKYSIAFVIFN